MIYKIESFVFHIKAGPTEEMNQTAAGPPPAPSDTKPRLWFITVFGGPEMNRFIRSGGVRPTPT